jgi:hypothetical protein
MTENKVKQVDEFDNKINKEVINKLIESIYKLINKEIKVGLISEMDFNNMKKDVDEIKEAISKKHEEDFSLSYIESKKVPALLGISSKTWQTYRDKGIIPFIQFGSKIWVKRIDLDAFLNQYYIKKSA